MRTRFRLFLSLAVVMSWFVAGATTREAVAQNDIIATPGAGVVVDAAGVLRVQAAQDPTGQLMRERLANAKLGLSADVQKPSALRKISLNRLEKAIEAQAANSRQPTDEMNYLAGLTRVQYVCY
jgi:hypothetical protein